MICPKCNNPNELDATFCIICGQPLALQSQFATTAAPPVNYGYAQTPAASSPPSTEIEALNYSRYLDLLCEGQSFLTRLAIRFYYITGLKSYLVTHHDCFVVPNLRRDAAETIKNIKQEMDGQSYQELLTTYLFMRTEHIQTLPYLSRSMIKDVAGVNTSLNLGNVLAGLLALLFECLFGIFYVVADFVRLIARGISQGTGMAVRSVGRDGSDEMLTGKRLILASTYRHTRTYTYVRDVGTETYVGWFTHHEPLPGLGLLFGLSAIFLLFGLLVGIQSGTPFLSLLGIAGGIFFVMWLAPWVINRLNLLPQPRFISGLVQLLWIPLMFLSPYSMPRYGGGFFGLGYPEMLLAPFLAPLYVMFAPFTGGLRGGGSADPILAILVITGMTAMALLLWAAFLVFLRAVNLRLMHFDQFDAETHSHIVKERIAAILAEQLESAGYSSSEVSDILSGNSPGAGRYRRARV